MQGYFKLKNYQQTEPAELEIRGFGLQMYLLGGTLMSLFGIK